MALFNHLSERLTRIVKNLTGQGRLTEDNIKDTLREIRIALLEADVALPAAKALIEQVENKAIGKEVLESLTPGQALIKIVHDELIAMMGEAAPLDFKVQPPAVILMAGLQGSGKTTTVAKLAKWLKTTPHKSVLLASVDVYRPAAIDQLRTLATQIDVAFFESTTATNPVDIALEAVQKAKTTLADVLIIDTAGRLHIDDAMMTEIKQLHAAIQPVETLFVVDSMTGQDAANTAKAFHEALPLTGIVLTKTDGDARGGAALSMRYLTGKPIKFMGTGEKVDNLEPFYPDRIASRILGMGDIVSLVEDVERKIDRQQAEKLAKKIKKGKSFDLEDFRDQLRQVHNMGGLSSIMSKLPGMGQLPQGLQDRFNDKKLVEIEAIINSMTPKERRFPQFIKNSHKRRIASGSGTSVQKINQTLKEFLQAQKMLKKVSKKGGIMKLMRGMQGKFPFGGGGMPPKMPF